MTDQLTIGDSLIIEGELDKEKELQLEIDGRYAWVSEAEARQILAHFREVFPRAFEVIG